MGAFSHSLGQNPPPSVVAGMEELAPPADIGTGQVGRLCWCAQVGARHGIEPEGRRRERLRL
jgi:hypothetical protein